MPVYTPNQDKLKVEKILCARKSVNSAVLFLHGLPAFSCRNKDLAEILSKTLPVDCYVVHYPGLEIERQPEALNQTFSVVNTIKSVHNLIKHLIGGYSQITIVMHSFGAVVGTFAMKGLLDFGTSSYPINLVYLAPLLVIPDSSYSANTIEAINTLPEMKNRQINQNSIENELSLLRSTYSSLQANLFLKFPSFLIEAKRDQVIPEVSSIFIKYKKSDFCATISIEDDHWFTHSRDKLALTIQQWIGYNGEKA